MRIPTKDEAMAASLRMILTSEKRGQVMRLLEKSNYDLAKKLDETDYELAEALSVILSYFDSDDRVFRRWRAA